ncbi:hypothetical protein GCM10009664_30920 [Kitasatospora gansuensis]
MSGIGKSELVAQYAARECEDFDVAWWVSGESWPSTVAGLTQLAAELGISGESPGASLQNLAGFLKQNRALVVIDGADASPDLIRFIPRGGHSRFLISSTDQAWSSHMPAVQLRPLSIEFSVELLEKFLPAARRRDLEAINKALSGHPLALRQAASFIAVSGMPAQQYAEMLRDRTREILTRGTPPEHIGMAAAWDITVGALKSQLPEALFFLQIMSSLSDHEFPKDLFQARVVDPSKSNRQDNNHRYPIDRESLAIGAAESCRTLVSDAGPFLDKLADPMELHDLIYALRRYSLLEVEDHGVRCHSLIQALARQSCEPGAEVLACAAASHLLYKVINFPPSDSDSWPHYAFMLPHFEAIIERLSSFEMFNFYRALFSSSISSYLGVIGLRSESLRYAELANILAEGLDFSRLEPVLYVKSVLVDALTRSDNYDAALEHATAALDVAGARSAEPLALAIVHSKKAGVLHLKGDLGLAMAELDLCDELIASDSGAENQGSVIAIRSNKANLAREMGDPRRAIGELLQCIEMSSDLGSKDALATLYCGLALSYLEAGDLQSSLESSLAALEIDGEISHDPGAARDWNNAGLAWLALGMYGDAAMAFQKSVEIYGRFNGMNSLNSLISEMNFGRALMAQGEYEDARRTLEKVLHAQESILGLTHRDVASTLVNLSSAYNFIGLHGNAVKAAKRAVSIDIYVYGENHPELIADYNNLAMALAALGQIKAASKWLGVALSIARGAYGTCDARTAKCLQNIGAMEALLGKVSSAISTLEESVSAFRDSVGLEHPEALDTLRMLNGLKES